MAKVAFPASLGPSILHYITCMLQAPRVNRPDERRNPSPQMVRVLALRALAGQRVSTGMPLDANPQILVG
jgi:hypothetical protein